MIIVPIEKFRFIRKINNNPLDINILYEFCRLMTINNAKFNDEEKEILITHTIAGSNHILEHGTLKNSDKESKLKIQIGIYMDSKIAKDFNIRLNVIRKFEDNSITYTALFKDSIDYEHVFDLYVDSDFELNFVVELIKESMKLTIKEKIKRWY